MGSSRDREQIGAYIGRLVETYALERVMDLSALRHSKGRNRLVRSSVAWEPPHTGVNVVDREAITIG